MRRVLLAILAGCLALVASIFLLTYFYERPTILRVAVPRDSDDARLVAAYAQAFSREREGIRFRPVLTTGYTASAAAITAGTADLAIVRTDVSMPKEGQTIAIMRVNTALIVVPAGSRITRINDLRGHRIGVVQPRDGAQADSRLLTAILTRYDAMDQATEQVPLAIEAVSAALTEQRIDAVFVVAPSIGKELSRVVALVSAASEGKPPVFIPVTDGKAIAQSNPALQATEIPRGAFGGADLKPAEDLPTIGVGVRMIAGVKLPDSLVGQVTRALFSDRPEIAATLPLANLMIAPDTGKDQALPVHPGAAAYLDGDEETFLEKYSDFFYIGAIVLSGLGSAVAALAGRFNSQSHQRVEEVLERLLQLLAQARLADRPEVLVALELEADAVLIEAHRSGLLRTLDTHRVSALALALSQVRFALRDQRRALKRESRQSQASLAAE